MLDIGCGTGGMLELAELRDVKAVGIDGDFTLSYPPNLHIIVHDFTYGPSIRLQSLEFDLAWSCEFLEHVEEQYVPNFMAAFQRCKYAVATAAPPGWAGHHHVNCQPKEYWINVFSQYGFEYDDEETQTIRNVSTMQKPFMQNNGMFFKRKS